MKLDLKENGFEIKNRALVNMVIKFWFCKNWPLFDQLNIYKIVKKDSSLWSFFVTHFFLFHF